MSEYEGIDKILETFDEGYQKLLTQADRKVLPPIGSQEGKGDEAIAYVHFFLGNWDWYAVEYDQKDEFYGLVKGFEEELGYFSLSELQSAKGQFGLGVERDMHFSPTPLSQLRGKKSERVEITNTQARDTMDKFRTGFLGEKSTKNTFKGNDMATSKMNEILVNLRHAIGEETIAAMTGPIATPLAQRKIERTFPKDEEEDIKGAKPVGSPAPQAGGDPRNYGKEAVKSAYPHGIKTEEKLGGGGDAFKTAPKATSTVKDPGLGKKEAPEGKAVMGSSPKPQAGGDAKSYGDEKTAPKATMKADAKTGTSEVKSQKAPSVDVKGKSIVGAPKEAKVDAKVKAYDDEKKVKDLGKGGKLSEDDLPLGAPKSAPVQTAPLAATGAPAITAAPPAEPNPEEVKYREIHISDELIPEVAAKVRELVQEVLPDAVPSVVLKFQANMQAAEAGKAALEAAGVKVTEID